jgi:hypothetical protein
MRLSHLGLPVRDSDGSQLFYATYSVSFKCLDPDGHRVEVYWEP